MSRAPETSGAPDDIDISDWPASALELVEIIGVGGTLRFIDAFAGRDRVYIPGKVTLESALVVAVGAEAAGLLAQRYGGSWAIVPALAAARQRQRKRLLAGARGTNKEVARRFGVTERWVRMVRAVRRRDPRQIDLFDNDDD